ncbi:translocation/assembly module TamB domain-containing protein [Janthinobacterium fluminis]|uniref:Translocation/assembly module TamB domain-containing protein n=1 Tax=Janthinobacterium fluminis TaxID=2987524 RepID=A0ABT5K6U9_9BURK|nr:translocation/assembly module TamB domain-containing protein [Janthinobacterium fluminis]MDC8760730.1 translocation/assembly module TamB domain-containing protein [Janthinobacterium fluminis]
MSDATTAPLPPARRRALRYVLIGLAGLALLLGGALWLLGREATLQALVQKIASASGGQISVSGVSGSLYSKMHLGRVDYRSDSEHVTADDIDISWSPLQYFSEGIAISELRVAALVVESVGPSTPSVLPTSITPPFQLGIADARLGRLTIVNGAARTTLSALRFKLAGDRRGWRVRDAAATTPWGLATASASIAAASPFALTGQASLSQATAPAGGQPATLKATLAGSLALLDVRASGSAGPASGDAVLSLAPFDAVIVRAADIKGRGIDPRHFDAAMPQAALRVELTASIDAKQAVSGKLAIHNDAPAGPLDQQRLPLRSAEARVGGTLTATTIESALLDFGAAGTFSGGGTIGRSGAEAPVEQAAFALHTRGIDLKAIHGSINSTKIAGDIRLGSNGKVHTLTALLAQDGLRLDVQASMADALLQVRQARLQAGKGSVALTGQLSLRDKEEFKASASASRFNPADFGDYPVADLNADIRVAGRLAPQWLLNGDFALRPSRLLNQALTGAGKLTAEASHISGVDAKVALGQNTLEVRGNFGAPGASLSWRVDARQLAAADDALLGALTANGVLSGSMAAPRSSFSADARGLGLAAAKRPVADSLLHANGELALAGPQRTPELSVRGTAQRFNPAAFGPYPAGSVNADFDGAGRLGADWRLALNLALQASTLSNAPLSGHAKVSANAKRLDSADLDLHLGANRIRAGGSFGAAADRLDWQLEAPQLNVLGGQFGGALRGAGALSGGLAAPALNATLDGKHLRLFGQHQIDGLRASANVGSGQGAADPLVGDLAIGGYSGPGLNIADARLQTSGTRGAHTLQLAARGDDFDASARLKGGFAAGVWSGAIEALANRGRFAFTLQAPAPLRLAGPADAGAAALLHPEQLALSKLVLQLPGGSVSLQSLDKTGPRWRSTGVAAGVPLNYLAQLASAWRDNTRSDLTLGAQWSLSLQAAAPGAPQPALAGMLHVFREQGDVSVGNDTPLALGLRALDARVDVLNNVLRLQAAFDGKRAGQARLDASVNLAQGRIGADSALTLNGSADMASLAWLAPLSGQPGLELDGALKLAVTGAGSIAAPLLGGDISGDKLVVNWAEQGLKLRNGQLQAKLGGDQLQLQRLSFDGGEGKVRADGWLRFANAEASMELKLVADKLLAQARPDRTLVLSGQSTLLRDQKRFRLEGKFKVDRALIELAAQDTPTQSEDVVVLGKGGVPPGPKPAPSLPLNIDLEADLGDAFQLKGKGLDAQLAGGVQLRVQDRRAPRVVGGIRVASGTYTAYGQKLRIEHGLLNFTGAYDNPGLNILAVRKRPEGEALSESNVEAGVEVRGTAQAPTAKLVSIPAVSDSEKLAWLVLGHGTEGSAGNELGLLTTAAGALFGGSGGGLQARLASTLGLDEVGLSQAPGSAPAKGLENTVVTVGKRLSRRAYLSFEQGTASASSLVKLRYKLNPRITLQFQTGTNNALDVLYTWAFD